jgi:hypothetical protein
MRPTAAIVGLALAAAVLSAGAPAQDNVQVKVVKYAELGQLVRQHIGKVVVVDLWATW